MTTISKAQQRAAEETNRTKQRLETERRKHRAVIDRLIQETGWAVCVADSDDPADPAPHFGYTIGRTLRGQPELCAWGHNREDIQTLLNLMGGVLERENKTVAPGDQLTIPGLGSWVAVHVPAEVFGHMQYAKERYTFLRAVRITRVA